MQIFVNDDCSTYFNNFDEGKIDLCIADPPYFRVLKKEKWDRFSDKDAYIEFTRDWAQALVDKMRFSGTLALYGCSVNVDIMCKINEVLENLGMEFVQEIVIDKGIKSMAGRIPKSLKMLPPVSENIFIYRKDAKPFVRKLLLEKARQSGLSTTEIKERLGIPLNGGGNWTKWTGKTEFPLLPTEENWKKICDLFLINIPYNSIRETYNGQIGLTNVWNDIDFYIRDRIHPSEKPVKLADRLIRLFSNMGDIVAIPFAGSGNDIIACRQSGRQYVATEVNIDIYNKAKNRIDFFFNSFDK